MEITLETIESLMKLLSIHKIDKIKLGDLELYKTKHEVPKAEQSTSNKLTSLLDEDEILYWSTSTPALTQEQIEMLSVTQTPKTKKQKKQNKDE